MVLGVGEILGVQASIVEDGLERRQNHRSGFGSLSISMASLKGNVTDSMLDDQYGVTQEDIMTLSDYWLFRNQNI